MPQILQPYLARAYGQVNIHQHPEPTQRIRGDDLSPDDFYHLFCNIYLQVNQNGTFDLRLEHAPTGLLPEN